MVTSPRRHRPDTQNQACRDALTPREVAVVRLLADGVTAAAIARGLSVSERTVHKHLEHVYSKLRVSDRLSAVLCAQDLGLVPVRAASRAPTSPRG